VVFAELLSFALDGGNRARITCICAINLLGCDQDNIGGASGMRFFFIFRAVFFISHLSLDGDDFFFAGFIKE
jgi:hypothetical protein